MKQPWLTVRNQASADAAEMIINGPIGRSWWDDTGVAASEFRDELKDIPKGRKIHVRINSEGGSIKDGLEIYNALKDRRQDVTSYIDGYALSIASIIPLAASRVISPKASIWMVHEPWSYTAGNADDHRRSAEMLDTHGDMLASVYAEETGKSKTEMREAMRKETWMSGEEALDFGLSDECPEEEPTTMKNAMQDRFAQFFGAPARNMSRVVLNMISAPKQGGENKNQKQIMEKIKLVALLKKHGVADASADWTDEQFESAFNKIGLANPNEPKNGDGDRVAVLEKQLATEKRARIQARVSKAGENKIANKDIAWWTDLAMNDEDGIIARIGELPDIHAGPEAPGSHIIVLAENPLEKIRKEHKKANARYDALKADWKAIYDDACKRDERQKLMPMAANTYSATLVTSFLEDGAITDLQHRLAALRLFSIEYDHDPYKPLATAVIKHVTAGATTQTDATDFESGNSTVDPISVVMHQYTQSFHVSNADLQSGLRMENLVTINAAKFGNKIMQVATVPITVAIFGAATVTSSAAAFSFSDLATLQAALKKSPIKNLIIDGAYIARIANSPAFFQTAGVVGGNPNAWRAFGWDNIAQNTEWSGAGANVVGFACHPQAIAGVATPPIAPVNIPGGIWNASTFQVEGLELTVAMYVWFNPKTRTAWTSYDIVFGVKEADTTAGFILASA